MDRINNPVTIKSLLNFIGLFCLGVTMIPVHAQTDTLEEIIVTARKREEALQRVPISVTAISAGEIEARGIDDLADVATFTPNLNITLGSATGNSPTTPTVFIRGVGQFDTAAIHFDPGVAIYADGVYVPRALGAVIDLPDVERVEILRGPQGDLFGRNAVGGAINIITSRPSDETRMFGEVSYGSYDTVNVRGLISGSLSDDMKGKASFSYLDQDGYGDRIAFPAAGTTTQDNVNGARETVSGRVSLLWEVNEDIEATLSADYSETDGTGNVAVSDFVEPLGPFAAIWSFLSVNNILRPFPLNPGVALDDDYDTYASGPNRADEEVFGINLNVDWQLGNGISVRSITAYRDSELEVGRDADGTALTYIEQESRIDHEQFSQELQFSGALADGRVDWTIGMYYLKEDGKQQDQLYTAAGIFQGLEFLPAAIFPGDPFGLSMCPGPFPPNVCLGGAGNPFNVAFDFTNHANFTQDTESIAGFGQGRFRFTDKLSLTFGLRYSSEDKDIEVNNIRIDSGAPSFAGDNSDSWTETTGRFSAEYQATESFMVYGSVARGFKSGGFNGRPRAPVEFDAFDPEINWTYEIGVKSTWLNNRLRFNATGFYSQYRDLQLSFNFTNAAGAPAVRIANAGDFDIAGFELEMAASVMDNFDLIAGLGHAKETIEFLNPGAVPPQDPFTMQRLPKMPRWTANVGGQFTLPMGDMGTMALRADYGYRSSVVHDTQNREIQNGYGLLNARVSWTAANEIWRISLYGTNLTDKVYSIQGLSQPIASLRETQMGRPQELGVSISASY